MSIIKTEPVFNDNAPEGDSPEEVPYQGLQDPLHSELMCYPEPTQIATCTNVKTEKPDGPDSVFINEDNDKEGGNEEMDEVEMIIPDEDVKPFLIPTPIAVSATDAEGLLIRTSISKSAKIRKPRACVCTICNSGFPTQQMFLHHMSSAHADKFPYKCKHCWKCFTKKEEKKRHETIHDSKRFYGEPKFKCDMCDKRYHLQVSLKGHRQTQHFGYKKKPYPQLKLIRQPHSKGVQNHRQPEKVLKIFQCPKCDLKYDMRCSLQRHMRVHTRETPFVCSECGQPCSSKNTLRAHTKLRHMTPSNNPRPSRPKFMANQPCPCTVCGKVFKTPSQLKRHMRLHNGEKPCKCEICGRCFRVTNDLRIHTKRFHRVEDQIAEEYKRFKCRVCGTDKFYVFNDLRGHRVHAHRHIPFNSEQEKPFGCSICGKPFYLRIQAIHCTLFGHDPTTLQETMFRLKCPECPEERLGYHNSVALNRHWMLEHNHLPFPIKYRAACGFYKESDNVRKDSLPNVRIRKEDIERLKEKGLPAVKSEFPLFVEFDLLPVQGPIFYRDLIRGQKRERRKSKTPKEPTIYGCHICGLQTKYERNLRRHIERHEEDLKKTWYVCQICQRRFSKETALQSHEKKCNVETPTLSPYVCPICNKGFRKGSARALHQRIHHKSGIEKRKPGRPKLNPVLVPKPIENLVQDPQKRRPGRPRKQPIEVMNTSTSVTTALDQPSGSNSINIHDKIAMKQLLGSRILKVDLFRLPI